MTAQVGDVISYLGETFSLHSNPLEQYFEAGHQYPKCLAEEIEYKFTANWRGYIAEWTIDNDILFITNITGPKGEVSRAMLNFSLIKRPYLPNAAYVNFVLL